MKILITGASSGLGAELARQYAKPQNHLILLARREDKLYALRKEIYEQCKSVEVIVADVTQFESLQKKLRTIHSLDMLILNAGVALHNNESIPTIEDFKKLYDVNVLANHAILEVLLPIFKNQHSGKIVFISSLASLLTMPTSEVYSSSKRALNAYAEGIKHQYKEYGIKVSLVLPGFIESEMTAKNSYEMPFMIGTSEGVRKIRTAIEKSKEFYVFPLKLYYFIRFVNLLPSFLRESIVKRFR